MQGALVVGYSVQHLLFICQYVSTGHPGALIRVQDKITQEEIKGDKAGRNFLK